ncbi:MULTISPECIES: hypothetical protein [Streptomyces]|uniref:hypothetical protein n=1 Tax=Streptomyces TaxID=1883 RepID=UPI00192907FB|nr:MULTISPECIES: hypothetical protein [Streptomyces]
MSDEFEDVGTIVYLVVVEFPGKCPSLIPAERCVVIRSLAWWPESAADGSGGSARTRWPAEAGYRAVRSGLLGRDAARMRCMARRDAVRGPGAKRRSAVAEGSPCRLRERLTNIF